MDEREANIDLLFRNGLKDYEALPPSDAWENIHPAIKQRHRQYIFLRVAAMIAIIFSISVLAYEWRGNLSLISDNNFLPVNQQNLSPVPFDQEATLLAAEDKPAQVTRLSIGFPTDQQLSMNQKATDEPGENIVYPANPPVSSSVELRSAREPGTEIDIYSKPEYGSPTGKVLLANTTSEPVPRRRGRWSLAAIVSPTYLSNFNSGSSDAASDLQSGEKPVISYSGGLAFSYKLGKRLSFQSGLYYSSYDNQLSGISSFGGFQKYDQMKGNSNFEVRTTNGTVYTNNTDVFLIDNASGDRMIAFVDKNAFDMAKSSLYYLDNSLLQNLGFIELPVILRYKIVDRTIDFNIIGGLSSNLLVNNSVYASLNGSRYEVGETKGINSLTFSSSIGMGMEYSFSSRLSFNLEPTVRYYLNPLNNSGGMNIHPYSFGIFSGLSYKF